MSTKLSPAESQDMVLMAEDTFNDTCTIHVTTVAKSTYADMKKTYVDIEDVPCGFLYKLEMQNERDQIVTLDADAILRLSLKQPIAEVDEVTCRGRRFQVDGIVVGRDVKVVSLKRTKTGSG